MTLVLTCIFVMLATKGIHSLAFYIFEQERNQ